MRTSLILALLLAASGHAPGDEPAGPEYAPLAKAFTALQLRNYDEAIVLFREAAALAPKRPDIRKNLGYTLLKTGDSEAAREAFGDAMRLDRADFHVALEYAFLVFEAKDDAPARKAEARRIFANIRDTGDAESRATADAAFQGIDEPLRAGIERWKKALAASAPSFSAHYELAQLAEQRDELELAAANYRSAFRLLPERKSALLELARVERTRSNPEGMIAALIAASRGGEPRTAELAREQLPARYPYVYEFRQALELDPTNEVLRRELAYLLVQMSENGQASRQDAEKVFSAVLAASTPNYGDIAQLGLLYLGDQRPDLAMPLLNRVLNEGDEATANHVRAALQLPAARAQSEPTSVPAVDPRMLAERSYQAGYMKDALRYFSQAQEANPADASLALRLGWTNNMLHDDEAALRWFAIARQSDDPAIAAEASRAWKNLSPEQPGIRTTVWLYPLYSSRWGDLFGYGQIKTEFPLKSIPFHPYGSLRLAGDIRRTTTGLLTQSLSENALIAGVGIAGNPWRGATAWFEAGVAVTYLTARHWSDYRGGISWARTLGTQPGGDRRGWFFEATADSVFISHFGNDVINYAQSRAGFTLPVGTTQAQLFWNQNITFDTRQQYWAEFAEAGPGFRVHPPGLPPSVWLNAGVLRGVYLRNEGNPRRPNFNDFRIGLWYAVTK